MCSAAGTDVGVGSIKIEISDPRIDGHGTAERHNYQLVGMIDRDVTSYISGGFLSDSR
jgi:hypothetical protein